MRTVDCPDWLSWRMQGIGGSDAPIVMKASPWLDPPKLWALKLGLREPQRLTPPMLRGIELEPVARIAYERETGIPMPKTLGEHDDTPVFRASFDGYNRDEKRCLEIKCPGHDDHNEARCGRIPKKYVWQCVHLCLVSGFDYCDYWSFDGANGVLVTFKRDRALERQLVSEELDFWKYVQKRILPPEEQPSRHDDGIFKLRKR